MTRTIRLTAAAMGLLAAGVSVGLAARPTAPVPDRTTVAINRAHAARVKKLDELVNFLDARVKAGICRSHTADRAKVALHLAKAEMATTEAEKLQFLKLALSALMRVEADLNKMAVSGVIGGPGQPDPDGYTGMQLSVIDQIAEVEIAIAKLEAKPKN